MQTAARHALEEAKLQMKAQADARRRRGGGSGGGTKQPKIPDPKAVVDIAAELGIDRKDLDRVGAIQVTDRNNQRQPLFLGVVKGETMTRFNKAAPVFVRSMEEMGEIVKLTEADGMAYTSPVGATDAGARLATRYASFLLLMKEVTNLGVLNGKDQEVLERITGQDPTKIKNLTPKVIRQHLKQLYDITGRDLNAKVTQYSGGGSRYEYPTWEGITRKPTESRGRTNAEINIQAKTVAEELRTGERSATDDERQQAKEGEEASVKLTREEIADRRKELVGAADELLSDGISTANIEQAEELLATLDRVPKKLRSLPGADSMDRHLVLATAIGNWRARGGTKTQETTASRTKKALAKAEAIRKAKKATDRATTKVIDRPGSF